MRSEVGQPAGEPGVAAPPVGNDRLGAGLGQRDHDLATVGVVGTAYEVTVTLEALDGAGHRRGLHHLEGGQLADGQLAVAVEGAQHRHRTEAQLVVGVALVGESAAQPHDREPELGGQTGIGARSLLDCGDHIVSISHYLC